MIIGVMGKKQSGKNTAANTLINKGFVADAFADDLKKIIYNINGIYVYSPIDSDYAGKEVYFPYREIIDTYGEDEAKRSFPDIRKIWQTFGTDAMQSTFGKSVWINLVMQRTEQRTKQNINTVITDVRFKHEFNAVKQAGGYIIEIKRPNNESNDNHRSETEIETLKPDFTIVNDGTIFDLEAAMESLLKEIQCLEVKS